MPQQLTAQSAIDQLIAKSQSVSLPSGLRLKLEEIFAQLKINLRSPKTFWQTYQSSSSYLNWLLRLPWQNQSQDILDPSFAQTELDKSHYGLSSVKNRILEFISVLSLQKNRHPDQSFPAPILLFVGLVGTGKTTIAQSIARILGRRFIRVPFGGLGDPYYLRGRSRIYPQAEPGVIIKGLAQAKTKNPVILLDEIDRIADDSLNTIMGILVELLDPEQNHHFIDHYIDFPFDLSQVFFCATCNNTNRIATAVLDRLEIIQMPSYSDEEKIAIARNYLLPQIIAQAGLKPQELQIDPTLWPQIVRPLGFDAGVRTLKRNLESLCRKTARLIVENKTDKVLLTESNLKQFIPQW